MSSTGSAKREAKAGFTLIELLVSVVILSCGLIVIYQVLLALVGTFEYADSRLEAARLAEAKIWEIEDYVFRKGEMRETGEQMMMGKRRTFNADITALPVSSDGKLLEIGMRVDWPSAGLHKGFMRHFYLLTADAKK